MSSIEGVSYDASLGVVVQKDGDSGDSAQRTAVFVTLLTLIYRWDFPVVSRNSDSYSIVFLCNRMISVLKCGQGRFMRSPIPGHWGNDPTNFSRDQHSMLMLAMAITGNTEELKETFMEIVKRGGFHQNFLRGTDDVERRWKCPDFISPSEISVLIRGLRLTLLLPILILLDLGFLFDLRLRKKRPWDYDNMLAPNLMFAVARMPTFVSRYAYRKYADTDFLERVTQYHDPVYGNGIAGMSDLFRRAHVSTMYKIGISL